MSFAAALVLRLEINIMINGAKMRLVKNAVNILVPCHRPARQPREVIFVLLFCHADNEVRDAL
jgi:hypothetical protein